MDFVDEPHAVVDPASVLAPYEPEFSERRAKQLDAAGNDHSQFLFCLSIMITKHSFILSITFCCAFFTIFSIFDDGPDRGWFQWHCVVCATDFSKKIENTDGAL